MKKIKLKLVSRVVILFMCICSIGFWGCEKETNLDKAKKFRELYELVGKEHNKGLDYIFNNLKNSESNNMLKSKANVFDISSKLTEEYVNNLSAFKNKGDFYNASHGQLNRNAISISTSATSVDKIHNQFNNVEFHTILNEIIEILMKTDKKNLYSNIKRLENIQKGLSDGSNDNDDFILNNICATGRYSLVYWADNYEKWIAELRTNNLNASDLVSLESVSTEKNNWWNFNWGAIGASDAIAAGVGATHLAISGVGAGMAATGPGGWIGIGAVIVGYGIEGSASAMLVDIFY